MKLTAILLLATFLTVSAGSNAQKITLNEVNAPLQKLFKEIWKQSGFQFVYTDKTLEGAKPVTINVKDEPLENVLKLCFAQQPFEFTITDGAIIIKQKVLSAVEGPLTTSTERSRGVDVSGKVTDSEGNPLAGASVKVKGTTNGTTTDASGVFVLKGVDENATLIFSYAEHETVELKVSGRTSITAALKRSESELKEVVINKGYYTEKQKYSVGNVTHIDGKVIEQSPVQNPLLALQGRVPGLEVTQLSGLNGSGIKIRIQGQNSINSGLNPLIVIDGVPFPSQLPTTGLLESVVQGGSPLNYINPNDIESVDVLKDADATAIYGSRAANGAILITTKKGKAGKTKVSVNIQEGWAKVTRRADMMNTRQYLDMRYEAIKNDGLLITSATNNDLRLWDTTRYTNWQNELIGGTAHYTNIGASISGGTAAMQYLIGGTFRRHTTVFPGEFDDKVGGLHFNISGASANQKLKVQLSGSYIADKNKLPGVDLTLSAIALAPTAPSLYNDDGTLNWGLNSAGRGTWNNPIAYTRYRDFNNTTKNLVSNANISYSILPGLEIQSGFGYTNTQTDLYLPTKLEVYRPDDRPFNTRTSQFGNRKMNSWIIEPQLVYKSVIGKGKLDGLIGSTILQNSNNITVLEGSGYSNDLVMESIMGAVTKTVLQHSSSMYKYNALFARLNYILNDKYILNLTGRRDGSSRFGDKNKLHNFWSIGTGWVFSEEKLIQQNLKFLSFGKLRASYGTTGNDQIADYSYISYYGYLSSGINYQNINSTYVNSIPNPHLQWEETKKLQAGLDLGFVNDRIMISGTFVRNRSSNQLISYGLPAVTGFAGITKNFPATIQNTSWEFILNTQNIKRKSFSWTSGFNLTIPRNKLVSFPDIEKTSYGGSITTTIVGQPLGLSRVYRYAGVDQATGSYMVYDKNGSPTLMGSYTNDRNVLISTLPKLYGGLQNSFSYKGFQVDFLFQFVRQLGPKQLYFYNGEQTPGRYSFGFGNQPVTVLDRWQKPGDNASFARFSTRTIDFWPIESDIWYSYDASYIRLKNLSVSWKLPELWLKKVKMQSARLYFQGQNLATISKFSGLDPESQSSSSLPPLQMWTIGVNMEF